jgi:plastocyanin
MRVRRMTPLLVLSLAALHAADIEGMVIVKRKLTKRTVTAPASAYARGVPAAPASPELEDALGFERTHVAVYLEGQLPSATTAAVMEQRQRMFLPDMLVIPAGSTVSFPNRDPIFHNVFSFSKPKLFDLGNYPKDKTRVVTFPTPGVVYVNCQLHPNMGAAIVVTPNGWATRPNSSGHFTLTGIPPGKYTIVAWHKAAGFHRRPVEVAESQTAAVQFLLPLEEERKDP